MSNNSTQIEKKRVAIIGSGVSALGAAWVLGKDPKFEITIFEAGDYIGGHTHTVQIPSLKDPNVKVGVDTGFIVCNPITYPNFQNWLKELDVNLIQSDMSFAVSRDNGKLEWSGDNLDTVFAQRKNLFSSDFLGMLLDIKRFNKQATDLANEADKRLFNKEKFDEFENMTLQKFLVKFKYSEYFYSSYLLPMTASIWSTPANLTFDKFPLLTLVRFMRNHVLLQVGGRPKWRTVENGSKSYIDKLLLMMPNLNIRLNTPVVGVKRDKKTETVALKTDKGGLVIFDHVIFACHTDEALKILGEDSSVEERDVLGSIKYLKNKVFLHRDISLMPKLKKCWASWNYLTQLQEESKSPSLSLTYWMNRLQPFIKAEVFGEVFVTMNPQTEPDPKLILGTYDYMHPLYSIETIQAQEKLPSIQNTNMTTFAGAWSNYGFHEDGLTSGLLAAVSIGGDAPPFPIILNGGYPTQRGAWKVAKFAKDAFGTFEYVVGEPLYWPWKEKEIGVFMDYRIVVLGVVLSLVFYNY